MNEPSPADEDYRRASELAGLGRTEDAKAAYLAALAQDPTHFGALNDLGTLLYQTDYRSAARLTYAEAVRHHPANPIGRINLANALLADGQVEDARLHYQTALTLAPDHPDAHQGMANLLQDQGDIAAAERHRQAGYRHRRITVRPFRGEGQACRVLLLASAVGGNVPTRFLLDETLFETATLMVEADAAKGLLPAHDLVFNAVGDADLSQTAQDAAEIILVRTNAPAINRPERVRLTGRVEIARSLGDVPGLRTPRVIVAARDRLEEVAERFGFPLLLRSLGYHTGRHFVRVEQAADLTRTAAALPGS